MKGNNKIRNTYMKRTWAFLLAIVMLLASVLPNAAFASSEAEENTVKVKNLYFVEIALSGTYTVDYDGERLVKSEDDKATLIYEEDENVEIGIEPAEGYEAAVNAETASGSVVETEYNGRLLTFSMPAENVTLSVEAVKQPSTAEGESPAAVVPDGEGSTSPEAAEDAGPSEGQPGMSEAREGEGPDVDADIPEEAVQAEQDVRAAEEALPDMEECKAGDAIADPVIEQYVTENADPAYVKADGLELVNLLIVKQTLGDASNMKDGDTIDSILQHNDDFMAVIMGMMEAAVPVYDLGKDNPYYVAYADTMHNDSTSVVKDVVFAKNNDNGEVLKGCHYDRETGLAYIPKSAYEESGKTAVGAVQVQLLQAVSSASSDIQSAVVVVTDSGDGMEAGVEADDIYEPSMTVQAEQGLSEDAMMVSVNGLPAEEAMYDYDRATGELTVYQSPAMVQSVTVQESEETILGKIKKMFAPLSVNAATYANMDAVSSKKIEISEKLAEGYYFYDTETMVRYTTASNTANTYIPYEANLTDEALQTFANWLASSSGTVDTSNLVKSGNLNYFQVKLDTASDKYIDFSNLEGVIATMRCGHIALSSGGINNNNHASLEDAWIPNTVGFRVLKLQTSGDNPYIVIGAVTQKINTQNGVGMFKVYIEPSSAALRIKKVLASDTSNYIIDSEMFNALDYDAEFNVYTDSDCTKIAKDTSGEACRRISASKGGTTKKILLEPGTYWVKEVSAPDKMSLRDPVNNPGQCVKKVKLEAGSNEVVTVKFSNPLYSIFLQLVKKDNAGTRIPGAVYGVYKEKACTTLLAKGTTDKNGGIGAGFENSWLRYDKESKAWVESNNLMAGTNYFVKEISAPDGYCLDPEVYKVHGTLAELGRYNDTVEGADAAYARLSNIRVESTETPVSVRIKKVSSNPDITNGNPCYSFKGAEFTIYSDNACTQEVAKLTADENGLTNEVTGLKADYKYYVKETTAPKGYKKSMVKKDFTLTSTNPSQTVEFPDDPINDPGAITIYKEDAETGEAAPQGDASLEGAQFEVKYYAGYYDNISELPAEPTRSWVFQTLYNETLKAYRVVFDDKHKISGDNFYIDTENNGPCIPLGTMTVQEIAGPEGYAAGGDFRYTAKDGQVAYVEDGIFLAQIQSAEDGVSLKLGNKAIDGEITIEEQVYRGDVELRKTNADTDKPMSGVKFKITSVSTGESHIITTDEDGIASTAASHIKHTASGGVWFGGGEPDDDKGALPYGDYEILELTDENTYGKDPYDATFTIDEETAKSGTPIKLTFKSDGEVVNETVYLKTTAVIAETETKNIPMEGDFTIVDTVEYKNLTPGRTYKFTMTPMVKETEEPFLIDEEPVSVTKEVLIEEPDGTVEMSFGLSADDVDNETLVMFEKIFYRGEEIQHHEDFESEEQSIYKPEIGTSLHDAEGGKELGTIGESVTITDTVHFENLCPGVEYQMSGKLMVQETEEPLIIDGKEVAATVSFTPQAASGTVDVDYTFDTTGLKNTTYVAFEELTEKDIRLAVHADIHDRGQTIYFPEIGTSAKDSDTGNDISYADEDVTIEDTVSYYNLIPEWEYVVKGTLMDKKTGEPAVDADGNAVTAETAFKTPKAEEGKETVDGEVAVTFTFNGVHLANKTLVAFESLSHDGHEYTVHQDLSDPSQTVHLPQIGTIFKDASTDAHISHAEEKVKLVDTVRYKNLVPGRAYTMVGTLYDQDTKSQLVVKQYAKDEVLSYTGSSTVDEDGKRIPKMPDLTKTTYKESEKVREVTVSKTFIPETANGTVDLEFVFDASALAGKSVVAFEQLLWGDDEESEVIASHEDITDKGQTVTFPSMKTTATIGDKKEAAEAKTVKVVDKVECHGLKAGREVTVTGVLMDKSTGKELLVNGKKVEASKTFKAKKQDCTVELTFTFDASGLGGKDLVAFEKAYDVKSGIQIAEHEDINDKDQTVKITKAATTTAMANPSSPALSQGSTTASAVKTGDDTKIIIWLVLGCIAVGGFAAGLRLRAKKRSK